MVMNVDVQGQMSVLCCCLSFGCLERNDRDGLKGREKDQVEESKGVLPRPSISTPSWMLPTLRHRNLSLLALALALALSLSISLYLSISLSASASVPVPLPSLSLPARPGSAGSPAQKTKQHGAQDGDAPWHQRTGQFQPGMRGEVLVGGCQGGQPRCHTGRHGRADVRHCGGDGRTQAFAGEGESEGRVGPGADRQHQDGGSGGGGGDGRGRDGGEYLQALV